MDFSLLLSSYATVWSNPEVLLMTFIGALGGVLLGAIPGMTATMGVALLIPFSFGMDLIPSIGLLLGIYCGGRAQDRDRALQRRRHPVRALRASGYGHRQGRR